MRQEEIVNNRPYLRMLGVVFALIAFVFIMVITGCYSPKKATKHSVKAYSIYPGVVASLHTKWFPIKDSTSERIVYTPGEVQWRYDTVEVDCDSVLGVLSFEGTGGQLKNEPSSKLRSIIRIPCPPCPISVDTFKYYKFQAQESTAALQVLQDTIRARDAMVVDLTADNASKQSALNIAIWSLIALGSYTLIRWILRLWLKINLP